MADVKDNCDARISDLFDSFKDIPDKTNEMHRKFAQTKEDLQQALEEKLEIGLDTLRLDQDDYAKLKLEVNAMKDFPNKMDTLQASMV